MVVVGWVVVWATGTVGLIDVADTRVLQALTAIRTPALTEVAEVAGVLASETAIYVLWLANLVLLIAARRWRHLFVGVAVGIIVVQVAAGMAATLKRPRPYEVEIIGPWEGFSMPSLRVTVLATFLLISVYSLVPAR